MRGQRSLIILLGTFVAIAVTATPSHPAQFTIRPGSGIGPVVLGMHLDEVTKVLGGRLPQAAGESSEPVELPGPGLTIWLSTGRVIRIRTTNPAHKTESDHGPGDQNWAGARQALCNGGLREASAMYAKSEGFEIHCPFAGVTLQVSGGRIASLSVVAAEHLR